MWFFLIMIYFKNLLLFQNLQKLTPSTVAHKLMFDTLIFGIYYVEYGGKTSFGELFWVAIFV